MLRADQPDRDHDLPFGEWPQDFGGDDRLAGVLLDRQTHLMYILDITGTAAQLFKRLCLSPACPRYRGQVNTFLSPATALLRSTSSSIAIRSSPRRTDVNKSNAALKKTHQRRDSKGFPPLETLDEELSDRDWREMPPWRRDTSG